MEQQICFMHLVSGEDIVFKCLKEDFSRVLVDNPFVMVPVNDKGQFGLFPWMPQAGETFNVERHTVTVLTNTPSKNLIEAYNQVITQLNSNIVVPPKNLLIPA